MVELRGQKTKTWKRWAYKAPHLSFEKSLFPRNNSSKSLRWVIILTPSFSPIFSLTTGFELAVRNSQFAKCFGSLRISFCIFSKNCESPKSDTVRIFRLIHWNSYILSYFKPIKYPPVEQISQRFIVHINFKIHTFFSSYHFVTS